MTEPYRPTWGRSHASICHWDLSFRFYTKEQCERFIALLMKEEIEYSFSYHVEGGDSKNPPHHIIEIHDQPWANNLATVAELLKQVDYEFD